MRILAGILIGATVTGILWARGGRIIGWLIRVPDDVGGRSWRR